MENLVNDFYTNLNWVDIGVLALLLFSLIVGLVRGFFAQVAGIIGVVGALALAFYLAPYGGDALQDVTKASNTQTLDIIAFSGIFIVVWGVWLLLTHYAKKLIHKMKFGAFDRVLGATFGVLKGGVVAYAILILIQCLPRQWPINGEIESSRVHRGVQYVDEMLQKQKSIFPEKYWKVFAAVRQFPDEPIDPGTPEPERKPEGSE